ncbi:hypothetical protein B0T22DRAFT_523353 [Podospora appendiculata]|uniref:NmrA-like domain-containing protein n=1 Tax=Podospora appendiculata TaxID=314037 RepID=A0AAE1C7B8_9PEZI|nr:hypothetical protein B0T22DRAFT_523353 [Podospora appendiculata]
MAPFAPSNVLIFGGTGTIGSYITASLLRAQPPPYKTLTLFTSPTSAASKAAQLAKWKAAGLRVVVGDLTSEHDVATAYASGDIDTVVSAVGRGGLQLQIPLLRLAEAAGTVRWFLPSEFGTDIEHNADTSPFEKPHQLKLEVRRYVREEVRRVQVTYVVTGPYFDMWVGLMPGAERAGGFDVEKRRAYVLGDGEGKVGFCTMWDVGKFVVATLRHPEASFGKALKVQSFVVSPNQVVAEFERQTGEKWDVTYTSLDEIRVLEAKAWEQGSPVATGFTLRRIWAKGGTLYEKNDNEVLGLGSDDLDSLEVGVARGLVGAWKSETF